MSDQRNPHPLEGDPSSAGDRKGDLLSVTGSLTWIRTAGSRAGGGAHRQGEALRDLFYFYRQPSSPPPSFEFDQPRRGSGNTGVSVRAGHPQRERPALPGQGRSQLGCAENVGNIIERQHHSVGQPALDLLLQAGQPIAVGAAQSTADPQGPQGFSDLPEPCKLIERRPLPTHMHQHDLSVADLAQQAGDVDGGTAWMAVGDGEKGGHIAPRLQSTCHVPRLHLWHTLAP